MENEEGVYVGNACMQMHVGNVNYTENQIGITYARTKNEAVGWLTETASKNKPGWPITKIGMEKVFDASVLQWAEAIKAKSK